MTRSTLLASSILAAGFAAFFLIIANTLLH
jgi:hypothetical protein